MEFVPMMGLAASALGWLFGNGLRIFTVPALIVGLLVAVHQVVKAHNEKIATAATTLCDARWESAIRKEERDAAAARARTTMNILESERRTNEELRDEIEVARVEADALRASGSTSNNCLSDGVLDALRKKR
jgi:hypothetical protein